MSRPSEAHSLAVSKVTGGGYILSSVITENETERFPFQGLTEKAKGHIMKLFVFNMVNCNHFCLSLLPTRTLLLSHTILGLGRLFQHT